MKKKLYNQPQSEISEIMPIGALLDGSLTDGGEMDNIWGD